MKPGTIALNWSGKMFMKFSTTFIVMISGTKLKWHGIFSITTYVAVQKNFSTARGKEIPKSTDIRSRRERFKKFQLMRTRLHWSASENERRTNDNLFWCLDSKEFVLSKPLLHITPNGICCPCPLY